MKKIEADEGYYFGLGVFETIAVKENRPFFLKEHLERYLDTPSVKQQLKDLRERMQKKEK